MRSGKHLQRRPRTPGIVASLFFVALSVLVPLPAMAAEMEAAGLAGQFLIAKPRLSDPNFSHTVIYICKHDGDGAFGLVLNRPVGEIPFAEFVKPFGVESKDRGPVRLRQGGPVQTGLGFILHSTDYPFKGAADAGGLCATKIAGVSGSVEILRAIAAGKGPRKKIYFFGYSGWGGGQLEQEIAADSWEIVPGDAKLLFDENLNDLWERATAKRGVDL